MVRIRLRRTGGKKQPTYRIVAADKEKPRDGRFLEILGDYNPRTEPPTIRVKEDRIYYWLGVGAQPSESVLQVFQLIGLMERYERHQAGEDMETLLEESKQAQKESNLDPRTRRDGEVKKAAPSKAEEATEESSEEESAEKEVEEVSEEVDAQETVQEEVEETSEEEAEDE